MNNCTVQGLIDFERRIADIFEQGELPFLIHLNGGCERQLITIFESIEPGDWVFASHRNHLHYLLAGGRPDDLEAKIRDGNSMFVYGKPKKGGLQCTFVSSAILAGTCCIAAGVAWQLKQEDAPNRVWCFLGDGASEEGAFAEAVAFVHGHDLPCTFIVENNDRQVDTPLSERLPRGSGIHWPDCVMEYHFRPTWPHAGTGTKSWVKFKPEIVEKFAQ